MLTNWNWILATGKPNTGRERRSREWPAGFIQKTHSVREEVPQWELHLTIVIGLLQQEAGPAVLLFNDEIILLQRFDEDLVLNLDWQTWQKQGTDQITLP